MVESVAGPLVDLGYETVDGEDGAFRGNGASARIDLLRRECDLHLRILKYTSNDQLTHFACGALRHVARFCCDAGCWSLGRS